MYTTATSVGSMVGPLVSASFVPAIGFDALNFAFAVCIGVCAGARCALLTRVAPVHQISVDGAELEGK
mgnify:CR=1 FL=1